MPKNLTEEEQALTEHAHLALSAAIEDSFLTMAGLSAEVGVRREYKASAKVNRVVAAVVGLMGKWNGTGILECTPEFACLLSNRMLGIEVGPFNEDALDAVAEMSNIIFGGMKTRLEEWLGPMGLSTPTVIYGNEVGMRSSGEAFTIVPISIEEHILQVKLYLAPVEGKRNPMTQFWAASCSGAL